MIEDPKTANERPISPNSLPRKLNKINRVPIWITAEYPTFVDSTACILAVIIEEIEIGIIEITIICSARMPSE